MAYLNHFHSLSAAQAFLRGRTGSCTAEEGGKNWKLCRVAAGLLVLDDSGHLDFAVTERIPAGVLSDACRYFRGRMPDEAAGRIYRGEDGSWFFHPLRSLEASRVHVRYADTDEPQEAASGRAVMVSEIHSHGRMPAFFSEQDRISAVYPGLYLCMGNLDRERVSIACCAEMDFVCRLLPAADVFAPAPLPGRKRACIMKADPGRHPVSGREDQ